MTIEEWKEEICKLLDIFRHDGISHDIKRGLNLVLKFQDLIGHASMEELRDIESQLTEEERKLFLWACFSCLDNDMAVQVFMKTTGIRKITKQYDAERKDIQEWEEAVCKKENTLALERIQFDKDKKGFEAERERSERVNRELMIRNLNLDTDNAMLRRDIAIAEEHAEDYDALLRIIKKCKELTE